VNTFLGDYTHPTLAERRSQNERPTRRLLFLAVGLEQIDWGSLNARARH